MAKAAQILATLVVGAAIVAGSYQGGLSFGDSAAAAQNKWDVMHEVIHRQPKSKAVRMARFVSEGSVIKPEDVESVEVSIPDLLIDAEILDTDVAGHVARWNLAKGQMVSFHDVEPIGDTSKSFVNVEIEPKLERSLYTAAAADKVPITVWIKACLLKHLEEQKSAGTKAEGRSQ